MNTYTLFHISNVKIDKFNNDFIGTGDDNNSALGIFATQEKSYLISHYEVAGLLKPQNNPYIYEIEVTSSLEEELEKDEYYGTEDDETNSKEHFRGLRQDFLEQGIDLITYNDEYAKMFVILDSSSIKIKKEITFNNLKKLV